MNRPTRQQPTYEISLEPAGGGWHCNHLYYTWDRAALAAMSADQITSGRDAVIQSLDPVADDATLAVADFGR